MRATAVSIPASRDGTPSLRQCLILAMLTTAGLLFLWFRIVPVFEDVLRDFGKPVAALEMFDWFRPFSLALQGTLLASLWWVKEDRARRQWWLTALVVVAGIVGAIVLFRLFTPVGGLAEVVD